MGDLCVCKLKPGIFQVVQLVLHLLVWLLHFAALTGFVIWCPELLFGGRVFAHVLVLGFKRDSYLTVCLAADWVELVIHV